MSDTAVLEQSSPAEALSFPPSPAEDTRAAGLLLPLPSSEAGLRSREAVLRADLERLAKVSRTAADAQAVLSELDDAQARLDADEKLLWARWASEEGHPPPKAKTAEREAIARRRALAAND